MSESHSHVSACCPICLSEQPQGALFSVGGCTHYFCLSCCIEHVQARIDQFQSIACPSGSCPQQLASSSPLYRHLPEAYRKKFLKHEQFVKLQHNSDLSPCQGPDCTGIIPKPTLKVVDNNQIICRLCSTPHCPRCLQTAHEGTCSSDPELVLSEAQMMKLNFRKCPQCGIWVERNGGCQHLNCKCGTEFCFLCGNKFQNDPCRKIKVEYTEREIRGMLRLSQFFQRPSSFWQALCLAPKVLLKLVLVLLMTVLSGVLLMVGMFGIIIPVAYLVSPAALFVMASEADYSPTVTCFIRVLIVVLYPLVGTVSALLLFLLFVTYPLMRQIVASHVYDNMDRFSDSVALTYLGGLHFILSL